MIVVFYRVSIGPGDSFNEFPTEEAANLYRNQQNIVEPAQAVEKHVATPEQDA